MRGICNHQGIQNDSQMLSKIQQILQQTKDPINKVGSIDPLQFETITRQLDDLDASLNAIGIKYFFQEKVQQFLTEILNQKNKSK